ncbi:MAG: Ribosome recycling factor [candidate division WS6 bacterium GW2011_GWE1_34_7]|uniref:Ribosome-recycling factor n=1 Tax=candidate division WS6 bacterium GW2011_GWE1_34_7 TaxID=1619093 RepID=A0A0G0B7V6_9BACT|nr:MAG: Ribosome recycling factor [candidate division WS6 bacterium GW2011_GWE1_34_7]
MDLDSFKVDLDKCIESLSEDLSQIRTGRATPELIQDILINAYETQAPLKNYATINVADTKSLIVIPWDKSIVDNISKGISSANMGFNPISEGDHVRVSIPELTEERRKEYVKVMKDRVEDARIAVRQVRQKYMQEIDDAQKDGFSEDQADRLREEGEKLVKESNQTIEEMKEKKEQELLTI